MVQTDSIQLKLRQWFSRETLAQGAREVSGIPVSIVSDIGLHRNENQDRAGVLRAQVTSNKSFIVAVLCDGMGGMENGADCAALTISSFLTSCIRNRLLQPRDRLQLAVQNANSDVNSEYNNKGGSTLSAILVDSKGEVVGINVGDSRIYCLSDSNLKQVSEDDTIEGQYNKIEITPRLSNQLLQFVGMGRELEPHLITMPNMDSISNLLLTSDGVHFIGNEIMDSIIRHSQNSRNAATRLVDLPKWLGGKDNASAIVMSELTTIFSPHSGKEPPSGTVEVWDAFGDVHLIGVERPISLEKSDQVLDSSKTPAEYSDQENAIESTTTPANKTKTKTKKKASTKKKTKKTSSTDGDEKPQMSIDFR